MGWRVVSADWQRILVVYIYFSTNWLRESETLTWRDPVRLKYLAMHEGEMPVIYLWPFVFSIQSRLSQTLTYFEHSAPYPVALPPN